MTNIRYACNPSIHGDGADFNMFPSDCFNRGLSHASEMGPIEAGSMESSNHEVLFGGTWIIVVSIKRLQNPTLLMHKQRPIKS